MLLAITLTLVTECVLLAIILTLVTELNDFHFHVVQWQGPFLPSLGLWHQVFHMVSGLSSLAIWTPMKKRSHLVSLHKEAAVVL